MPASIVDLPPDNDSGAETLARYRYQAAYAALLGTEFLNDSPDFKDIFCEHWEDVLVRRADDTFVACQVKTRDLGYGPFEATDDKVLSSIRRFCLLESQFPKQIRLYRLVTNCGCWAERKTGSNLEHLLELAAEDATSRKLNSFFKSVSGPKPKKKKVAAPSGSPFPDDLILAVLRKTEHQQGPALEDCELQIIRALASYPVLRDCSYPVLAAAAKALISLMFEAACKSRECAARDYFSFLLDATVPVAVSVGHKRVDPDKVRGALAPYRERQMPLAAGNTADIAEMPVGLRRLRRKMAAGDVRTHNVEHTADCLDSADGLFAKWFHRYPEREARERHRQVNLAVRSVGNAAHDASYRTDVPFGQEMFDRLAQGLQDRLEREPQLFPECHFEHLLGTAGGLTRDCKLWWSDEFDVDADPERS